MFQLSESASRKLMIALAVYITSLIAANTLGLKIMPFWFGLHLSVGVFMFPIVFLMTDVVGELYGRKIARFFVLAGFVSTTLWILYSMISLAMPWAAAGEWVHAGYDTVFGVSARIAIASLVAFAVAEYQDVFAFFLLKDQWGKRLFWLRSTLSNLWSQLLDTVIFMGIAFYGVYANDVLFNLIISWWLFKVAMGLLYTPLSYVGLYLLRDTQSANVGQIDQNKNI
jgi:queuosine precursor transporter